MTEILNDIDITDNPILITCDVGTLVGMKVSLFKHGQLQEIPYEIMEEDELYSDFLMGNLKCNLEIVCLETEASIHEAMQELRKRVASGSVAFAIPKTEIFLTSGNSGSRIHGIEKNSTIADLGAYIQARDAGDDVVQKKNKKVVPGRTEHEIILINMLLKKTRDKTDENLNKSSGKITVDKSESRFFPKNIKFNQLIFIFFPTQSQ